MAVKSENFLCELELFSKRSTRYLLWIALGVTLSAWGDDDPDSQYLPLFDKGYPRLEIGFEATTWTGSRSLDLCGGSCSSKGVAVSRDMPDEARSYKQEFNLNLGHSGPFSFRFLDRRLKMEVNF